MCRAAQRRGLPSSCYSLRDTLTEGRWQRRSRAFVIVPPWHRVPRTQGYPGVCSCAAGDPPATRPAPLGRRRRRLARGHSARSPVNGAHTGAGCALPPPLRGGAGSCPIPYRTASRPYHQETISMGCHIMTSRDRPGLGCRRLPCTGAGGGPSLGDSTPIPTPTPYLPIILAVPRGLPGSPPSGWGLDPGRAKIQRCLGSTKSDFFFSNPRHELMAHSLD